MSQPYLCGSRCLTLTSAGIHEGGEGASEHLEEGVSNWVALGPTQGSVLQDVCNTSAVHWGGAETNTEGGVSVCGVIVCVCTCACVHMCVRARVCVYVYGERWRRRRKSNM